MKRKNSVALPGTWLALALASGPNGHAAQSAALASGNGSNQDAGSISGRVQNVATGKYLINARVSVKGTALVAQTDATGTYQLVDVRSGPVVLAVFYTDMDVTTLTVTVPAGGRVEQDVDLTSKARYGATPDIVKLDPYVVPSDRETDSQSLAINEQRFAPNIKNVLATDALGNVMGSDVGEFLKFIPGLTTETDNDQVFAILVRGIPGDKTGFTTDGSPTANAGTDTDPRRTFNMSGLSLSTMSRIEVTKVPTPSTPADSLGGSINMISKSAFERRDAELRYSLNLVGNSENLTLRKTPNSIGDHKTRKILPGYDLTSTLPIGKNFGVVLTASENNKFNEQHIGTSNYNSNAAGTGASLSRPYLQQYTLQDGPLHQTRTATSFKADWRVIPHAVLSLSAQHNRVTTFSGNLNWNFLVGTNATPTVAGGQVLNFGDDFVAGATGRGSVTQQVNDQSKRIDTDGLKLDYRFDNGRWKIDAGVSASVSSRSLPDTVGFGNVQTALIPTVRVSLLDITPEAPGDVRVFDNANLPINIYDIANYRVTGATVTNYGIRTTTKSANLSLRRRLNVFPFPTSLQLGGYRGIVAVDSRRGNLAYTSNGTDGNPATNDPAAAYQMQVYANQDSHFGFKKVPWASADRAWNAWKATPSLFSQTTAQVVAAEVARITGSEYIQETVSALYVQGEARFFSNRLNLLTGVRFEKTEDEGEGAFFDPTAVFMRNANGSFARNAAGARIRRPEAGTAGSIEELRLTRRERGFEASRAYDGYYPSLHLTYPIQENFLARAAYARTYGRPNYNDILPNAIFNENDLNESDFNNPAIVRGTITVRNPSLRPWSANNYDLSLEYYTAQGGVVSAGVFLKKITDFFGNEVRIATLTDLEELGLDPQYVNWNLSTKFNSGDAQVSGAEINFRQSLRQLGRWGGYLTVFANATKLQLAGSREADLVGFIEESGNWGVTFSRKQLGLTVRYNYRGRERRGARPALGADVVAFFKARSRIDLEASYQWSKRLSLAGSVSNLANTPQTLLAYGAQTPGYARVNRFAEYGVGLALGLRGTF
jgi:iron complex outermembrane recepter protein